MVTEGKYTDIIGKKVHVIVDRPAGSYHPRNHGIFYSINYGYIEDIIAGDGSGQDVYIIGQGRLRFSYGSTVRVLPFFRLTD